MTERFHRTEILLGPENLERLRNARAVVAGLGAVGSYAAEALARSGIGHFTLVDFDTVSISNINRQLYALESTIGMAKTEVALARIQDINPACQVETRELFIDKDSIPAILEPKPDILLDAIDSLTPKIELLHQATVAGIPVVSSMGAATRTDPNKVRVDKLNKSHNCPLAKLIRKHLRRRCNIDEIICVYSSERKNANAKSEMESFDRGRPRAILGSTAYIPGMFGLAAAGECIRLIIENQTERFLSFSF